MVTLTTIFLFLLYSLASYRVTRFLAIDEFPPIDKLRTWAVHRVGTKSPYSVLFTCPFCLGTWVTLAATLLAGLQSHLPIQPSTFLLFWWGMMGMQSIFSSFDNYLNKD